MATLSDLVAVLSLVTGLPEATVFAYGRFAREAGLIGQHGRGRAAATMTVRDAANLLIALAGTAVTREAGKAISKFRPMCGRIVLLDEEFADAFCEWLKPLGTEKLQRLLPLPVRFGDFLEFLIQEAGTGALARFLRTIPTADIIDPEKWETSGGYNTDQLFHDGILGVKPRDETEIGIDVLLSTKFIRTKPRIDVEFKRYWDGPQDLLLIEFYPRRPHVSEPDHFGVTAEVSLNTITALGLALSGIRIPRTLRSPEDFSRFFAKFENQKTVGLPAMTG
jgi:hypothetical protein